MNLYAHQKEILALDPKKTGLFLGTGSGKTLTALLLSRGFVIIICPKTQREDQTWERQAEKIPEEMRQFAKLWVMSKEDLKRDLEHVMMVAKKAIQYGNQVTFIVDEAHTALGATPATRYIKKEAHPRCSQIFEAVQQFVEEVQPDRIYLCTATIVKSPMTVWAAGTILGKKWPWEQWRQIYYTKLPMPGREVWAPRKDNATKDRLAERVRDLGHVGRLEDFFDVPDQTFRTVHIKLTPDQKQRIKELPMEFPDPIVQIGKKHQVENGVLAGNEFAAPEVFKSQKIEKVLELAEEFPKMIIFAKYTAQIEALRAAIESFGRKVYILSGDTKDRGKTILEASTCAEYVFICQSQISAGWELPECPVVVFVSKTYSFVDYDQALGRVQRANNIKKNLYISLVVAGGVDEAIENSVANKCDFNERIYAGIGGEH